MYQMKVKCNCCSCDYDRENRVPKMLPCGHTYCLLCIQKFVSENSTDCPSCGGSISTENIESLPTNIALIDIAKHFMDEKIKRESRIILNDKSGRTSYVINLLQRKYDDINDTIKRLNENINALNRQIEKIENSKIPHLNQQSEIKDIIDNLKLLQNDLTEDNPDDIERALQIAEEHIQSWSKESEQDCFKVKDVPQSPSSEKFAMINEGGRTRYSRTTNIGKIGYRLHVLSSTKPALGTRIVQYPQLDCICKEDTMVFLDLFWKSQMQGRIVVQLYKNLPKGEVFHLMCSGRRGISHRDINTLELSDDGQIKGGIFTKNFQETFMDLLNVNTSTTTKPTAPGLVSLTTEEADSFCYTISLWNQEGTETNGVIGEVVSGMEILRAAARYEPHQDRPVTINDCGLIIHY